MNRSSVIIAAAAALPSLLGAAQAQQAAPTAPEIPVRAASSALVASGGLAPQAGVARKQAAIHRNDLITVEYFAPGVRLSVGARALEDGAEGEAIRVINTQSNSSFQAIVAGPGLARATARSEGPL